MKNLNIAPEHTAVRTALWRALHLKIDAIPFIFFDDLGEKIIGENHWKNRPDMDPARSAAPRASIVARARFIEDLLESEIQKGITQYVILGAGLDTFALRRKELLSKLTVFEVDQEGPQKWKEERIKALNISIPDRLKFVPVNFEKESWLLKIKEFGFEINQPTLVVSTGVTMYLTNEVNLENFKQVATLAKGSCFITTFMLPVEMLGPSEKELMLFTMNKAKESGTPFISLYSPEKILELSKMANGLKSEVVLAEELSKKYFQNRTDGLSLGKAENFIIVRN